MNTKSAAGGGRERTTTMTGFARITRLAAPTIGAAALIAASITLAPQAASAGTPNSVPFTASYSGSVSPPNGPPPVVLTGAGKATHLGNSGNAGSVAVTGPATNCPDSGFAVQNDEVLTSTQSGEQLMITIRDESCPITPGVAIFHGIGTYVVTGGTGRFAGATGEGTFDGTGDFVHGLFSFTMNGTLSAPIGG